jgi:putative tryptophan/tyrosine transport system substrate-binding protein
MNRRTFLYGAIAALPAAATLVQAQRPPARARIGVFFSGSPETGFERTWGRSFASALGQLGWKEGQNLTLEWRYSEDREDRRRAIIEELLRMKVDVMVVQSTPESIMAKRMTTTVPVPVVMVLVGDPVGAGLVTSLAHPGGNITGTSLMATDTAAKRLQLLKEVVPMARRVAVLGNLGNASVARSWEETQEAAVRLGLKLLPAATATPGQVAAAFAKMAKDRPDALVVILDSMMVDHRRQIVEFAAEHRLPAIYGGPMFAEAGGLLVYSPDFHELWRRAALYVDRILKGASPGDLPIEQPTKFQLVVNLKTAKALGVTIPDSVRLRADEVIE